MLFQVEEVRTFGSMFEGNLKSEVNEWLRNHANNIADIVHIDYQFDDINKLGHGPLRERAFILYRPTTNK